MASASDFSAFVVTETDTVLEVLLSPTRIRVATRKDEHSEWELTEAGVELLATAPTPVVESANTSTGDEPVKRTRKAKVVEVVEPAPLDDLGDL